MKVKLKKLLDAVSMVLAATAVYAHIFHVPTSPALEDFRCGVHMVELIVYLIEMLCSSR